MWYALRVAAATGGQTHASHEHILYTTARSVIAALAGLYAVLVLISELLSGGRKRGEVWFLMPLVALTCVSAYLLVPNRFLAAQAVLQGGAAATIITVSRRVLWRAYLVIGKWATSGR